MAVASHLHQIPAPPPPPPLPNSSLRYLITGPIKDSYLEIGVPLYEASRNCDWNAAKSILDEYPEIDLVRCSITENGETALHIAASAKGPKRVEQFVKNLVSLMSKEDLLLVNKNHKTALYLAATAGNLEAVKIMVGRNRALLSIPGGGSSTSQSMMPLYAAALFGRHEVVKYLYDNSRGLHDDGWFPLNRGGLLNKCVETDMFDVALDIVKRFPQLGRSSVLLGNLARKPYVFSKSGIVKKTDSSVSAFNCLKARTHEKESDALPLLRIIWEDIVKLSKKKMDDILKGPPDSIKSGSGRVVQTILEKLIFDHLDKLDKEAPKITEGAEHVLQLKDFLSKHVVNIAC